jgi:hypothetical protein
MRWKLGEVSWKRASDGVERPKNQPLRDPRDKDTWIDENFERTILTGDAKRVFAALKKELYKNVKLSDVETNREATLKVLLDKFERYYNSPKTIKYNRPNNLPDDASPLKQKQRFLKEYESPNLFESNEMPFYFQRVDKNNPLRPREPNDILSWRTDADSNFKETILSGDPRRVFDALKKTIFKNLTPYDKMFKGAQRPSKGYMEELLRKLLISVELKGRDARTMKQWFLREYSGKSSWESNWWEDPGVLEPLPTKKGEGSSDVQYLPYNKYYGGFELADGAGYIA